MSEGNNAAQLTGRIEISPSIRVLHAPNEGGWVLWDDAQEECPVYPTREAAEAEGRRIAQEQADDAAAYEETERGKWMPIRSWRPLDGDVLLWCVDAGLAVDGLMEIGRPSMPRWQCRATHWRTLPVFGPATEVENDD